MSEKHARNADGEGEHLVLRRMDAHRLGCDLILANGEAGAAVARVHKILDDEEAREHQEEHPGEVRVVGDALKSRSPADIGNIDDHDADDLAETERCDCEVVAAQAQGRQTDERAEDACRHTAREERCGERQLEVRREHDADVGADRHEPGMAERELPRIAVDEVEARREDDVDSCEDKVQLPECTQHAGARQPHDDAVDREGEDEDLEIVFLQ